MITKNQKTDFVLLVFSEDEKYIIWTILDTYFKEVPKDKVDVVDFKIEFRENILLKYIGLPRKLYVTYFMVLFIEREFFKQILIGYDEIELLKPLISRIHKLKKN